MFGLIGSDLSFDLLKLYLVVFTIFKGITMEANGLGFFHGVGATFYFGRFGLFFGLYFTYYHRLGDFYYRGRSLLV